MRIHVENKSRKVRKGWRMGAMVVGGCSLVVWGFSLGKSFFSLSTSHDPLTLSVENGEKLDSPLEQIPIPLKGVSSPVDVNPSPSSGGSAPRLAFREEESLRQLRKALTKAEDYLDASRRRASFRQSGFDTRGNYNDALFFAKKRYTLPLDPKEVERRVLSLHFLRLSQHTTAEDCLDTLRVYTEDYQHVSSKKVKRALLWDVSSMAVSCNKLDSDKLNAFQSSLSDKTLSAQFRLATGANRSARNR